MVRKSERNKTGSDKGDKPSPLPPPTRKATRASRRRKKSTSESDNEADVPTEEKAEEIPLPPLPQPVVVEQGEPSETKEQKNRRGRPKRIQPETTEPVLVEIPAPTEEPSAKDGKEWKEDDSFWGETSKTVAEPPKMDDENSTWKVQSSNGAGGEIQKLKICRQRLTDSAESSSSPSKEVSSPRRKRKDRHLEGDGTESTGSHTDSETPTSTVIEADPSETPSAVVEPTPIEENSTSHQQEVKENERSVENEESVREESEPAIEQPSIDVPIEAVIDKTETESTVGITESVEPIEPEESSKVDTEPKAVDVEDTLPPSNPPEASVPLETEEIEEGELKSAKKTGKNLKLAVSNEDAIQQIAKKLNERAARFSKEATEEAARRLVPHKFLKETVVEDEEEEGEISRDPSSTKTLELKRLNDEDENSSEKKRCRRTPSAVTPSTPSDEVVVDVSTELLKEWLPEVITAVSEDQIQFLFNLKVDELIAKEVNSDEEDNGETGEIVEEEGELLDENKEERWKSSEDRDMARNDRHSKRSSREEPKKIERRVTKEPKESRKSKSDKKERKSSGDETKGRKNKDDIKREKDDKKSPSKNKIISDNKVVMSEKIEENHKSVRKIAIVSDDAMNIRRSISPVNKKTSPVLFITNLVRPFTIGQLRELLARTGTISPNGFYIDNIKSKCFVKYNDVDMAIETRHALHGVSWPNNNPKTLRVEFSTDEAMEAVKKLAEEEDNAAKKQDLAAQNLDKGWLTEKDVLKPPRKPKNSVREWDMGKEAADIISAQEPVKKGKEDEWGLKSKDKKGEKDEIGKRRGVSPPHDKNEPARKIKRRENDAPARLLDDLFRKTKATPCIYWLPLTASQIAVKEEIRRQHMAEHQKRLAEMKKTESARRDKDKSRNRDRERERDRDRRRK